MRRAFTLVEFVVVVGVFCVIGAIIWPTCLGSAKPSARRSICQSNLKQIGLAFKQYRGDNDDRLPPVQTGEGGWADSIQPYVKSWQIFQCPENGIQRNTNLTDYFYNARCSKLEVSRISALVVTILAGDGESGATTDTTFTMLPKAWRNDETSPAFRHLDRANYLFADGHVKTVKATYIIEKKPKVNDNKYSFLP